MHANELVELAATLVAQANVLVTRTQEMGSDGLQQYWVASRCRLDRWGHFLKCFAAEPPASSEQPRRTSWTSAAGVVEEIIMGEVLARVWAAIAAAHDRHHGVSVAGPIARSVLIGHLESRNRVLALLVRGPISPGEAMMLDRLRRCADRWSDMLVGYLAGLCEIDDFAVDLARAKDFAADLTDQGGLRGGPAAWSLLRTSLRAAFRQSIARVSPNADLNARIAGGIFASFPAELFDSSGLAHAPWTLRMSATADDAQGLIGQLLALDCPSGPPGK